MAPPQLHIRKTSRSDSFSTISSPSPRTPVRPSFAHPHHPRLQTQLEYDPLSLHPVQNTTHQPPPPLSERPFLQYQSGKQDEMMPMYPRQEAIIEQPLPVRPGSSPTEDLELQFGMDMSPASSPSPTPLADYERTTPRAGGRFNLTLDLPTRPVQQCSRWSESTIASLDLDSEDDDDELDLYPSSSPVSFVDDDVDDDRPTSPRYIASQSPDIEFKGLSPATRRPRSGNTPTEFLSHSFEEPEVQVTKRLATPYVNFSYKRNTVAHRPQVGTDDVENFIKRGGWKRRGIVFEADTGSDRTSAHTIS